jgi:phage baseplate assembly protein W
MNPFTGVLARVTNEHAVAQSLRNFVMCGRGERFYDSNKGSRFGAALFELFDPHVLDTAKADLIATLQAYEPRAQIINILVDDDPLDANSLTMTMYFAVINIPNQQFSFTVNVRRVR